MSVAGISSVSPLQGQDQPSQQQGSSFQSTAQKLQSLQLETAKQSANGMDTVKLSGFGQGQKLASDVSTLSHHLQTGDLAAAQTAYQAVREDLKQNQAQPGASGEKALPGSVAPSRGRQGDKASGEKTAGGAPKAASGPKASNSIDVTG